MQTRKNCTVVARNGGNKGHRRALQMSFSAITLWLKLHFYKSKLGFAVLGKVFKASYNASYDALKEAS